MTFHSNIIGGSTAKRRLNCPGSQALEAKFKDDGGSAYAREGSALHTLMENWIAEDAEPEVGEMYGSDIPALTSEQKEALQWCFDIVDPLIGDNEFELEVYHEFPGIEGAGGTCDVVVFNEDESYTLPDYKFGRGVPVIAEGNEQLMFYAACIREKYGPAHTYHLHILQPRLDSHTKWSISDRDLVTFINQVQAAVANFNETYNPGTWCKFCKGQAICPSKLELAEQAKEMQDIGHNQIPAALALVDELEEWCAEVRKTAHGMLEKNQPIMGWKLVEKRATRKWALDDNTVRRKLKNAKLKIDQYAPRKTITAPQAEKLGFKLKDEMVEAKSSGTTLVRDDDPRPAVSREKRDISRGALANAVSKSDKDEEK